MSARRRAKVVPLPTSTPSAERTRTPSLTPAGALRVAHLAVEGILWRAESERYNREDVRQDLMPISQMLLDAAWVADGVEGA
jgi:hypothetical protein